MPFSVDYSGSGNFDDQYLADSRSIYVPAIGTIALVASAIAAIYLVKKKCDIDVSNENSSINRDEGVNDLPENRHNLIVDIRPGSSPSAHRRLSVIQEEYELSVSAGENSNNSGHVDESKRSFEIYI